VGCISISKSRINELAIVTVVIVIISLLVRARPRLGPRVRSVRAIVAVAVAVALITVTTGTTRSIGLVASIDPLGVHVDWLAQICVGGAKAWWANDGRQCTVLVRQQTKNALVKGRSARAGVLEGDGGGEDT